MLNLSQIRDILYDRRIGMVSDRTGVHPSTIASIRDGKNTNPTYAVMKSLSDYLEREI